MSQQIAAPVRTRSQALQERAERLFPGGVNSPVRAFRAVGGGAHADDEHIVISELVPRTELLAALIGALLSRG